MYHLTTEIETAERFDSRAAARAAKVTP